MDYFESILLGIVQGLTEFLPISSSGHIEISKVILGSSFDKNEGLLFTIILHFATALSTMCFFRKDLIDVFKGLFTKNWNESKKILNFNTDFYDSSSYYRISLRRSYKLFI